MLSLIGFQTKPFTSQEGLSNSKRQLGQNADGDETSCESCNKILDPSRLLKHIGNSKDCKTFYGSRFLDLKRQKAIERTQKYRSRIPLKDQREKYAKNFKLKDKNKLVWQKQKEINQKKKQERLSLASKGLNINGKEWESDDEGLKKSEGQCEFCREKFDILTILKHIGNSEACKIYYGPRYEEWKKEHKNIKMRIHREEFGIKKELEQQRKRYTSDPKVREKKKNQYEKHTKNRRNWELVEQHKTNCHRLEKIARERNSKGLKWLQDSFEKIFEEFKNFNNEGKEKISALEKNIEDKFMKIDSEIDFKVKKYLFKVENYSYNISVSINEYHYIFEDFIRPDFHDKPLYEKNRIDLIWHDMKQTTEVKLEEISNEIGKPFVEIPWHPVSCCICQIYRKPIYPERTKNRTWIYFDMPKYYPPRFAHEQDPDMML